MIGRREFLGVVGGAAASWPFAARSQQPERCLPHCPCSYIGLCRRHELRPPIRASPPFSKSCAASDMSSDRIVIVDRYSGDGHQERYVDLAREVVRTKPHLIVALSVPLVLIFKTATDLNPHHWRHG